MASHRPPVGRIAALSALLVGAVVLARGGPGLHWEALRPGLEFATLRGDPFCRQGSPEIALLRVDPSRLVVRVHHYALQPQGHPLTAVEWQRLTGAYAVFNAGQFYPDLSYMGALVCDGRIVSGRTHPSFKAALVAGPRQGTPAAHVLDLERDSLGLDSARWSEVAQSFMLFDRSGRIRVRHSDKIANRTGVGEDRRGRLVIITTEGGYALDDFARLLQRWPLQLSHAMSMDGGDEAQLCVVAGGFRYTSFGGWRSENGGDPPDAQVPLPAVISVSGR